MDNTGTKSRTPNNPQQKNVGSQSTWPHSAPTKGGNSVATSKGTVRANGKQGKGF